MAIFMHSNAARNTAWPSQALIAERTGFGVRSVRRHLESLEADGWVSRKKITTRKMHMSVMTIYTLIVPPHVEPRPANKAPDDRAANQVPVEPINDRPIQHHDRPNDNHDRPIQHHDRPISGRVTPNLNIQSEPQKRTSSNFVPNFPETEKTEPIDQRLNQQRLIETWLSMGTSLELILEKFGARGWTIEQIQALKPQAGTNQ